MNRTKYYVNYVMNKDLPKTLTRWVFVEDHTITSKSRELTCFYSQARALEVAERMNMPCEIFSDYLFAWVDTKHFLENNE